MNQYGLIGYPLSHSFSKKYFSEKFEAQRLVDYSYDIFPIPHIELLSDLLAGHPFLKGLNVTIPYKERVLPFLNELSDTVREIGASNCIAIQHGKLTGYNTDVIGFERSLKSKLQPYHSNALILGTGGAAKAIAWVLKKLGIGFHYITRSDQEKANSIAYQKVDEALLKSHTLLINTTPAGMYPDINSCPDIPYQFITNRHFLFDLIYNPADTVFLKKGRERGAQVQNGGEMLIIQAEESWKIWNGIT
jgi:shikimate dehydrogenase